MTTDAALTISQVSHRYGQHLAVDQLSLEVAAGQIFVLLGPNGCGKTTLFRVLSTLIPLQTGDVSVCGYSLRTAPHAVRRQLGVVFQAPSLDKKLTVAENLKHQGRLYGLTNTQLQQRQTELLTALGLAERAQERVETLSGGQRRRVELAKGMLHQPRLLLMDEPSTGLDPAARADLWRYLQQAAQQEGMTIVLTTHLLEEAERADRMGIMDAGRLVALDTPTALQAAIGGDSITIQTRTPAPLAEAIAQQFDCPATVVDGTVRLEQPQGHRWISRLVEAFPAEIQSITLGKPTLEDVFIHCTGHRFLGDVSSG